MTTEQRYWDPRIETMRPDEVRVVQGHRLRWQVERCWNASPFYRDRLSRAGVEPADVREAADVSRLPILTRAELEDEQRAHPPHGRLTVAPTEWWREGFTPDGAPPPIILWSEADLVHRTSLAARALWSYGVRAGDLLASTLPASSVSGAAVAEAGRKLGATTLQLDERGDGSLEEVVRTSRRLIVATSPPGARHSGSTPPAGRDWTWVDDASIVAIWGGALDGRARQAADPPLGAASFMAYGTDELGPTLAAECEARAGLHWAEDHLLVEVLDPATLLPAPDGDPGALVITHLTREATPLLRFWTGQRARLVREPCACGRTHARSPISVGEGAASPP